MDPVAPSHSTEDQSEALRFLGSDRAYGLGDQRIERIDTHGSIVFLAGERVYKVKRAVRYPYMDYGTLVRRRFCCEREVELNRRSAPDLYFGVEPIVRGTDGRLAIGGIGEPVEWAVVMRRVPAADLFDRLAADGRLDPALVDDAADALAALHGNAEKVGEGQEHGGGADYLRWVIADNADGLNEHATLFDRADVERLRAASVRALDRNSAHLDERLAQGFVRRCHGDLHLGNLCLWNGRATLFDAIEFNDRFACIDVFYDLAFLLMELDRRVGRTFANHLLNRYLRLTQDIEGLAALPLFLSLRAAIRAKVSAAGALAQEDAAKAARLRRGARAYLRAALDYLAPAPVRLVAVGGRSGSGKSTLARLLAPRLGPAPGALHLRSDVIRKAMFGVEDETRLPVAAYAPEISAEVYRRLGESATAAMRQDHAVVADAVFDRADSRAAIAAIAAAAGVRFDGVWLEASPELMRARLRARTHDVSDATPAVLDLQLGHDIGALDWPRVSAEGTPEAVADRAAVGLGLSGVSIDADPDLRLQRGAP
jgi:hypothetical protein